MLEIFGILHKIDDQHNLKKYFMKQKHPVTFLEQIQKSH